MTPAFVAGPPTPALRASALPLRNAFVQRRPARRFLSARRPLLRAQADPSSGGSTATTPSATATPGTPSTSPSSPSNSAQPEASTPAADPTPAKVDLTKAPPPENYEAPTPSTSTFLLKFDDMRGKPVEPVGEAMARFNAGFRRPVPIVYRAIVNEVISTSHLARVCAMWRFDSVFAYGFDAIFNTFLRFYPDEKERAHLFECAADSLRIETPIIREAADAVAAWLDGKTEDDIFAALDAATPGATADSVGPVIEALAFIRDSGEFDWYYSRLFGLGLIQIMVSAGVELTESNAERWAEKIGMQTSKFTAEMGNYLSSMERLKQAEQIFAEATAREAKKTADRLAEKAKRAADEAAKLERGEDPDAAPTEAVAEDTSAEKKEDSA